MVGQVCLWMVLLILFGMTAIFIRLVFLFIADVASFLTFVPLGSLLPLQAFGSRRFPL